MVRTRRSVAAADEVVVAAPIAEIKKPRGRPRKSATPAVSATASSVPTPATYTSGSEYATPLTSHSATPTPSLLKENVRSTRSTQSAPKIEVAIPVLKASHTMQTTLRSSTSATASKRKRNMVADSQEDDSDDGHDAKLARMLQDEEDAKVASSSKTPSFGVDHLGSTPRSTRSSHRGNINVSSSKTKKEVIADSEDDGFDDSPDATLARKLQAEEYGEEDSEEEAATSNVRALGLRRSSRRLNSSPVRASFKATGKSTAVAKGKQSAPTRNSTRRGVAQSSTQVLGFRTAKDLIADSQDDDDDFDSLSAFESDDNDSDVNAQGGRPSAAQKGKGKAIAPPPESEDENYISDNRARFLSKLSRKGRPSAAQKGKGKAIAPPPESEDENDSDDSVPSLPDEADEMSVLGTGSYVSIDEDPDFLLPPNLQASVHGSDDDEDATLGAHIAEAGEGLDRIRAQMSNRRAYRSYRSNRRVKKDRLRLEKQHPELTTMWKDLENMPVLKAGRAEQPKSISRQLKPFQLEGLAWMTAMEKTEWKGGLLGDEMGLGKTIQAVSLIMSDYPAKKPSLVLVPPVALMQWMTEIESYTDGTLKTLVVHGTNSKSKNLTVKNIKSYDVIIMSYNSLESMYRKQEKGFKRKEGLYKEKSVVHQTEWHRVILDEAHSIKSRTTMTAKACFALKVTYRWCLSGTPLQNRIGEFFSLIRFLNIRPFACYLCRGCPCKTLEWGMDDDNRCKHCNHSAMQHVSVFNQELLNPIQKFGNRGEGALAFKKLRILTDRIMLRRLKKDHTNAMELPVKEINVERQFFGEVENDFANSIMTSGQRKFDTYVATGVLLNNYANIFGLIMQMRQVADHPDLILKKNGEGGQNVLVCCICDEPAEDAIRSRCKHDFCRVCVKTYVHSATDPNCPSCHIPLSIDLEQPELEQDEAQVKKSSIINRIKMENWTSSSKIELLVHELHKLRSDNASHKSIIFSQFTTMLQLIEWRLRRAGITTVMLDGSMTPAQRQASINHFMTNVDVECFLVSLKAGGVALNLTEASRVFIVDPWWNPAAEWQSADRCHRIGQSRPCTITRLCIEDSVESRMVLLQEKKTNMINSTINADDAAMDSLSPEDLQFLFRGN
ncbi:SNF2 family N-terminal domain-containing protein [Neurospora hispaniola]|uniref:SNF2 family N-terminal domain-containing protein n=1 Tax=Neurospora hispaniola TaxID=588809 RepID=A0AAJ0IFD8_9PEZI|nr:SNF2 family N-terminal domain-containing protein [Neurospora hispaniola]